jgi:queuine tRNA-ribosyltransferase
VGSARRAAFDAAKAGTGSDAALFGIVQGGVYATCAQSRSRAWSDIGFEGYAIGGLAVGEHEAERLAVLEGLEPRLPAFGRATSWASGTPSDS